MTSSRERKRIRLESGLPDTLSPSIYNLAIGACILYGFLFNAIIVKFFAPLIMGMNYIAFLIGYFVLVIVGTLLTSSHKASVSFLGYSLVVLPIGAVLAICLPAYALTDILSAIVVTGLIVAVMMGLSAAFPHLFARMGWTLLIALGVSLLAEVIAMLLGYGGGIFNWIFVILFSLYVGYDWHKAQIYPKTLDNAVDSALDLYLDIINIFIRLLMIFSRRRD